MDDPNEYYFLINFFIRKRQEVDGNETDFTFNVSEIVSDESPINTKTRLIEIIEVLKKDSVLRDYTHEQVITGYSLETIDAGTEKITIKGSLTEKFESYIQYKIRRNNPNLAVRHDAYIRVAPGTKWEHITIQFINEETVNIFISRGEEANAMQYNFAQMGFQNLKTKAPNIQWEFLRLLSMYPDHAISSDNPERSSKIPKRKQLLSETLKKFFIGMDEDPFHDCKTEGKYEIKMNLIPIGESSEDQTISEPVRTELGTNTPSRAIEARQQEDEDELDPEISEFLSGEAPLIP